MDLAPVEPGKGPYHHGLTVRPPLVCADPLRTLDRGLHYLGYVRMMKNGAKGAQLRASATYPIVS